MDISEVVELMVTVELVVVVVELVVVVVKLIVVVVEIVVSLRVCLVEFSTKLLFSEIPRL